MVLLADPKGPPLKVKLPWVELENMPEILRLVGPTAVVPAPVDPRVCVPVTSNNVPEKPGGL